MEQQSLWERYIARWRRTRRWQKIVTVLSCMVVFCTTYALILPAITLETTCGRQEHIHNESCYVTETVVTEPVYQCTYDPSGDHHHDETCLDPETGALICGLEETPPHVCGEACLLEPGTTTETTLLVCDRPEHTHDESCYPPADTEEAEPEEGAQPETEPEDGSQPEQEPAPAPDEEQGSEPEAEPEPAPEPEPEPEPVLSGDPAADLETRAQWEKTLEDVELTGLYAQDLLAVAASQLGYRESERNFIVNEAGRKLGYSRYGAWYGSPYGDWCAMFVSFCLHYSGIPAEEFPLEAGCERWIRALEGEGLYEEAGDHTPRPGDLIFFNWDEEPDADHVGIVREVKTGEMFRADTVITIEGNASNRVKENRYDLEDPSILGYGLLPEPDYRCGLQAHQHSLDCFGGWFALTCGLEEHIHTEACLTGEPAEETSAQTPEGTEAPGGEEAAQALPDDQIAEAAEGTNWMTLRDSGWFEAYSSAGTGDDTAGETAGTMSLRSASPALLTTAETEADTGSDGASGVQVDQTGGRNISKDGAVTVSKTIAGTELENVFDITLRVQTPENIGALLTEPDMAVVIVMDISNTMKSDFGGVSRYAAAMEAAEGFLDLFAAHNSLGISKVGYVAFNTSAHTIFGLQPCTSQDQADALKNTMRTQTGEIINAEGYAASHTRFTNVEAGLKLGSDMLAGVSNKNKFIIFLSDGFPTTYISSGYTGYSPYTLSGTIGDAGVFYDFVSEKYCNGTSYSDTAAIRARKQAAEIKASGTRIFSIGVDIGGQTIAKYVDMEGATTSIVERTSTTYEIGSADSADAYKNWLKNSIGSGYYYDSTNTTGLTAAFESIFEEIESQASSVAKTDWVATDPIPSLDSEGGLVEFIGFYTKGARLTGTELSGSHIENGENTAQYKDLGHTIRWDLKESGYTLSSDGTNTLYTYELVYRVRLENELDPFAEGTVYDTNEPTHLQYCIVREVNGEQIVSDPRQVYFPIPAVHGFLGDLTFRKVDSAGRPLAGAKFTLSHDPACSVCRGDGTAVAVGAMTVTSDENGTVTFAGIPSGHSYLLEETVVPPGYSSFGYDYLVTVAYDTVTVTVTAADGTTAEWDGTIVNQVYFELPETGGRGTDGYTLGGLLLLLGAGFLLYRKNRGRREVSSSS